MVITQEFKLSKTFEGLRSLLAHHRPSIEAESFTEEPVVLSPGESRSLTSENGIILFSPHSLVITGDVNLTVDRYFACFSAMTITVVNDANNTSNMEARAYIF